MRYEVNIVGAPATFTTRAQSAARLDPASMRELELFLSQVPPGPNSLLTRPVIALFGSERRVIDVNISFADDGGWHIALGEERPAGDAPDIAQPLDTRLDDLTTMVWVTDRDRLARWFNAAWLEFVGSALDDELGWGWMRHIHSPDLVELLSAYESAQADGRGFEHVARVTDGASVLWWVRVRAAPRFVDGTFEGFLGMCEPVRVATDDDAPAGSGVTEILPRPDLSAETPNDVVSRLARLEDVLVISRPADTIEAGFLRRLVSRWITQHEALRSRHDDILLCVTEAAANCIVHAYRGKSGRLQLSCEVRDSRAEFRVRDWGSWRQGSSGQGGRGIALMRALSDELRIEHLPDGTEVVLGYGP
jgi:anti-sigma regulatory factor (Ser/Thr protein kinase)/PAS domain-containing protein